MNEQQSINSEALIQTIADGFKQIHDDNKRRESMIQERYETELKVQHKKNFKWKIGAFVGAFAIVVLGYSMHKTINVFEDDMNSMALEMTKMSGYMESMSIDMGSMEGNIGTMAPDMKKMSGHIESIDKTMGSMNQDMDEMNRAMSPLMFDMQRFMP